MFIDKDNDPTVVGGIAIVIGLIGLIAFIIGTTVALVAHYGFAVALTIEGLMLQFPAWFMIRQFNRNVKLLAVRKRFEDAR